MDLLTPTGIALILLVINVVTFLRFWWDKIQSQRGGWRTPEADLLGLALVGGTPAAYLARHLLRHKTRKQPFSNLLFAILMLQLCALLGVAIYLA